MITQEAEISIEEANSANIPVHITFYPVEGSQTDWQFEADNYMPRRALVVQQQYDAIGPKEEIAELIRKHVLPLYKSALCQVMKMSEGKEADLYYWTNKP